MVREEISNTFSSKTLVHALVNPQASGLYWYEGEVGTNIGSPFFLANQVGITCTFRFAQGLIQVIFRLELLIQITT